MIYDIFSCILPQNKPQASIFLKNVSLVKTKRIFVFIYNVGMASVTLSDSKVNNP